MSMPGAQGLFTHSDSEEDEEDDDDESDEAGTSSTAFIHSTL